MIRRRDAETQVVRGGECAVDDPCAMISKRSLKWTISAGSLNWTTSLTTLKSEVVKVDGNLQFVRSRILPGLGDFAFFYLYLLYLLYIFTRHFAEWLRG